MSLDISPDGKTLVFDLLGDLYTVPVAGGNATRLVGSRAWEVRPVWSPDGQWIAFISDRSGRDQVYVVDATTGKRLSAVTSAVYPEQPDGRHRSEGTIQFAEWMPNSDELIIDGMVVNKDGRRHGAGSPVRNLNGDAYYGNGKALYIFRSAHADQNSGVRVVGDSKFKFEIWNAGDSGRTLIKLPEVVANRASEAPSISADGNLLIYRDRSPISKSQDLVPLYRPTATDTDIDTIRVYERSTGKDRVLVGPQMSAGWRNNGGNPKYIGFSAKRRYAISADSKYLFVAYGGQIHKIEIGTGSDEIIPVSVDVDQCLAPILKHHFRIYDGEVAVRSIHSATMSPSESLLAFSSLRRIYVSKGRNEPRVLFKQVVGQFYPTYSPDGNWLAYVTWSQVEGGHVWRIPVDGGVPERLTSQPGYYTSVAWSPDGRELAFVGSPNLKAERPGFMTNVYGGKIQIVTLADGSVRKLRPEVRLEHPLIFSEDGKNIFFVPYVRNDSQAVKLSFASIDGSQYHASGLMLPRGGDVSMVSDPAGKHFAVVKNWNIYLISCKESILNHDLFSIDSCLETRVTTTGGAYPRWRDGGQTLEWTSGNSYFQARLDEITADSFVAVVDMPGVQSSLSAIDHKVVDVELNVARRSIAHHNVALAGATIVTSRGDEVIDSGTIVIVNGRIEQIGSSDSVRVPVDMDVINLKGKTIIPGLIDAHAHFNEAPRGLLAKNYWEPLLSMAFGVTTIRDPSNGGAHAFAYEELVEAGEMIGPRIFGAEGMVSSYLRINSYDDALGLAQRSKSLGATFLKYHTGWNREQRRWIFNAANKLGMNAAAHVPVSNGSLGRLNLTTIADGATTTEHGISYDDDLFYDVKQYLVQSHVAVCFTPIYGYGGYPSRYWHDIENDPRIKKFFLGSKPGEIYEDPAMTGSDGLAVLRPAAESRAKFISDVSHMGARVMIGSHGDYDGIGMHWEMWAHVRGGMTPHEVLRAATINGAYGLGMEADLGSLEVGKVADLLILNKNPLEDIRNTLTIERVMKNGVLRDAMTLDEVWPTPTPLPAWGYEGSSSATER